MTLTTIKLETAPNPTVSVIWMHGLGADGRDFVPLVKELDLQGCPPIRFIFPNAPRIPVTINGGFVMPAWYDIKNADIATREDEAGIRASQAAIEQLMHTEQALGAEKIVLAGFSQGCAMTLQVGLRQTQKLAGLLCLSGYLPLHQTLRAEHQSASLGTPIFMAHGNGDKIVPLQRAQQSRDLLTTLGYNVEWHEYDMEHTLCFEEIRDISTWFKRILK
ncbi:MAG: alpha/beta hydrolase [Solimicrobium sp.]|jgi:phospholipase/carboxylesterase|nr:alpha/beta hydrolase [Solimicrobium sp.]